MKNYLVIIGAMALGAVIMFGFTHGDVMAEEELKKPEQFICSDLAEGFRGSSLRVQGLQIIHCRAGKLDCGVMGLTAGNRAISCVNAAKSFK